MSDETKSYELAKYFCTNEIKIHVTKNDGIFYNGIITQVKPEFFFMVDREDGIKLVFFKEIKKLSEFLEAGK